MNINMHTNFEREVWNSVLLYPHDHSQAAAAEIFEQAITEKLFDLALSNLVCG